MQNLLRPLALPALLLAAAACTPIAEREAEGTALPAAFSCNAALYSDLVGQPIDLAYGINPGFPVRILGPDDFVPRDFNSNRLTFTTTPDETIGRVFCG